MSHGRAVSEGGALRVPGGAVVLTAAVSDAPPLDDTTPLPEEGALARAEGDSDALVEGGVEMEGDSVPLQLPLGDVEGVPRNVAVGCGEVEGLPLPETARAVSVGRPTLLLGE